METTTFTLVTRVTGTETKTYEIQRVWDASQKRGLIIELYPTITKDRPDLMDLSSFHLHNHMKDLELGSVTICNLYSTVFARKPLASQLLPDEKNLDYIEKLLDREQFDDIIIAWGSSLSSNKTANEAKLHILKMLTDKNLTDKVKHIVGESLKQRGSG